MANPTITMPLATTPPSATKPLLTDDGLTLHVQHWPADPAAGPARGVAVIVHGLGEHSGRYDGLARRLAAQGFAVVGYDQRGHGRSPGARGRIARDDSLLADLSRVIDLARKAHPGPLLLIGHSLGGLVAARFVAEGVQAAAAGWARRVDALVLSSPAFDAGTSALQRALLATVARVLPDLAVGNGLQPAWLSRDALVVAAYTADPRVHDRIAGRLGRFIAAQGPATIATAPRWKVPTLLMWAEADRCVAPAGSAAFAAAAPPAIVTARSWPALRHEIFNEPEQAEVMGALDDWLARVLPARGGPAGSPPQSGAA